MKIFIALVVFFALFGPSIRQNSSLGWQEQNAWDRENRGFRNALIAPDRQSRSDRFGFASPAKGPGQARANDADKMRHLLQTADDLQANGMMNPDSNIDHKSRINAILAQIAVYQDSLRALSSDLENHEIEIGIMKGRIAGLEIWLAAEKARIVQR